MTAFLQVARRPANFLTARHISSWCAASFQHNTNKESRADKVRSSFRDREATIENYVMRRAPSSPEEIMTCVQLERQLVKVRWAEGRSYPARMVSDLSSLG